MTESEADLWYSRLSDFARSRQLGWVVEEVEAEASMGELRRSKLDVSEAVVDDEPAMIPVGLAKRRKTRATFVVARQFTARERLALLIKALEIAVSQHTTIANHVASYVSEQLGGAAAQFAPELETAEGFRLSPNETRPAVEAGQHLDVLLTELLREVEDAP